MRGQPAGIMLPECTAAADALRLADILSGLEARDAVPQGQTRILPIATEAASAMLDAASYRTTRVPRLAGLLWGGEGLAADIGATSNRAPDGACAPLYQLARSLCLLAATAAGLCHSYISQVAGLRKRRLPVVGGHEAAGIMRELGAGVAGFAPGEHVVMTVVSGCGHCRPCAAERPALCQSVTAPRTQGMLANGACRLSRNCAAMHAPGS